jgi:hypothetical protein
MGSDMAASPPLRSAFFSMMQNAGAAKAGKKSEFL